MCVWVEMELGMNEFLCTDRKFIESGLL